LAAASGLMARELVGERMLTWIDERPLFWSINKNVSV